MIPIGCLKDESFEINGTFNIHIYSHYLCIYTLLSSGTLSILAFIVQKNATPMESRFIVLSFYLTIWDYSHCEIIGYTFDRS